MSLQRLDHPIEDWDRVFAVNVSGMFPCSRVVVSEMVERRRRSIVNIASIAAFWTTVPHIAYSASKGAVASFIRDLAVF